jgi:hypothetical protein
METSNVSASQAKAMLKKKLSEIGFEPFIISTRKAVFEDSSEGILVTIYRWRPHRSAQELKEFAKENGFRIRFN